MKATSPWNEPGTTPTQPGDYPAALEPATAAPSARYHWNGKCWLGPFHVHWTEARKAHARLRASPFYPFWRAER